MKNNPLHISIVVIGYNTGDILKKSLESINNLIVTNHVVEVVYVDDGSVDNSFEMFSDYNLKFNKKQLKLNENHGRSYARSEGIKMASGEWILFLNSNIIVESHLLLRYSESMLNKNSYAYGGCVNYSSVDSVFEKYLNDSTRGIKKYQNNQNINYQNLLFSNCMIKKSIFDVIKLNLNFKCYGGEELDFASKLEKIFPKMMTATRGAIATRINFPDYKKYLYKLIEFGESNLKYLDNQLKLDVVKSNILLKRNVLFKVLASLLYYVCRRYYKIKFIGDYIIKIGMLSAILKGYYKTK